MVQIMNKAEELMYNRLARRGFAKGDCEKVLGASVGGVIVLNKRSFRYTNVQDFAGIKGC